MNTNRPLHNLPRAESGERGTTRRDVENAALAVLTSDTYLTLPKWSKIIIRGDKFLQNDSSIEGNIGIAEERAASTGVRATTERSPLDLKDAVVVVIKADIGCLFQDPEGYDPDLMIPCTNDDLEESPPLNRGLSPHACIPLPEEDVEIVVDELSTLGAVMTNDPAPAMEGWPTIHEDGFVIRSCADDSSHPQSTGDGSNPRRKRSRLDDGRRSVRRRMGP